MAKMHKILPALTVCFSLLAAPLQARTGAQIAQLFDTGVAAYDAGRYDEAFKIWWGLQYEDVAAMRNIAMMLRRGQGTTRNPKRAMEIYERAAEAGLPTAQADLADMLLKGEGGRPDPKKALPLLRAAAAANHPIAQFQLGQMFETGAGGLVPRDIEVARKLYAAAANRGMKEASERLLEMPPPPPPAPAPPQETLAPSPPAARP
ncbi:MAG: hypothetical protein RJB58_1634 [Pseudomonadota bacterium]|jgi:TPR repeat protein